MCLFLISVEPTEEASEEEESSSERVGGGEQENRATNTETARTKGIGRTCVQTYGLVTERARTEICLREYLRACVRVTKQQKPT